MTKKDKELLVVIGILTVGFITMVGMNFHLQYVIDKERIVLANEREQNSLCYAEMEEAHEWVR